jgi:hypothetical protein
MWERIIPSVAGLCSIFVTCNVKKNNLRLDAADSRRTRRKLLFDPRTMETKQMSQQGETLSENFWCSEPDPLILAILMIFVDMKTYK